MTNTIALCFLTPVPNDELISFAHEIATRAQQLDVCIMIDDNSYQSPASTLLHFLQVNEVESIDH